MTHDQLIDMLNELLAYEQASAPIRLMESTVFVSQLAVSDATKIKRMADQSLENAAQLTQLVLELGGAPGLRVGDVHSGDLHFQNLRFVLPRLIENEALLIHRYKAALTRTTVEPKASELLSTIMARHQTHLDQFESIDNTTSQSMKA